MQRCSISHPVENRGSPALLRRRIFRHWAEIGDFRVDQWEVRTNSEVSS